MPERAPIRIAELGDVKTITALAKRVFQPAGGRASLPLKAAREALKDANPELDLEKPGRLPAGTVIAVPEVTGAEPAAKVTRAVAKVRVEPLREARPELKQAAKRLEERASAVGKAASETRRQTLSKGTLRKVADAVGSKQAGSMLDRLQKSAEAEGKEADAAARAQAEAVEQLEDDVEQLVEFLEG